MDIARDKAAGGAAAASARHPDAPAPERGAGAANGAADGARFASAAPVRPSLSQLIDDVRAAFSARIHLFELEAKRAAWSTALMLAFAVGAALLGVTAWLILIGALIYGAVAAGVPWGVAAIAAIALHAIAVFFLVRAVRSMVDNLTFGATRRTFAKADAPEKFDGRDA